MKERLIETLRSIVAILMFSIFIAMFVLTVITFVIPFLYWLITGNSYFDFVADFVEFLLIRVLKNEDFIEDKKDFEQELKRGGSESFNLR